MRIFVGIDLDSDIRSRISRFIEGVEGFAPNARWMRPESLHITLKFIGEQPPERVEAITERLRRVESNAFEIRAGGYGFFPTAKLPASSGSEFTPDRDWRNWPRASTLRQPNSAFLVKTGLTAHI